MTLSDLRKRTLMLLKMERTTEEIAEYTDKDEGVDIDGFLNDAAEIIYKENWTPFRVGEATVTDGALKVSDLPETGETVLMIKEIRQGERVFEPKAGDTPDDIAVVASGTVRVKYSYLPAPMEDSADEPIFPAPYHDCLADYAAYQCANIGRSTSERGTLHMVNFENKRTRIPRSGAGLAKFINKY